MKKLTLQELEVTSFDTSAAPAEEHGTVRAHSDPGPIVFPSENLDECAETEYLDCTYICSFDDYTCSTPCP